MKKILSSLVMTILLSSCAVEKEKLTENVGKYVPPNIDDTNFKNSVITKKIGWGNRPAGIDGRA